MRAIGLRERLRRTRDRTSRPRVATELGLGLGDQGRDRGFFFATGLFGH